MKKIVNSSIEHGLKVPAVRAIMLAGMLTGGIGLYISPTRQQRHSRALAPAQRRR
jgi:hypothetical protein